MINGIFYGFSAAIRSLSESDVEKRLADGDRNALRILRIMENPSVLVSTIPVIAILTGILFGMLGVGDLLRLLSPYIDPVPAAVLSVLLSEILLAGLGVFAFRRIGGHYPERCAWLFVRPVCILMRLVYPLTWVILQVSHLAARPFGIRPGDTREDVTEEDLLYVVGEAHEQGVIEENEAEMIQNIIDFGDKEAKDIMTHRSSIIALDVDTLLGDAIDIMVRENNSRYPVYEENIDNIVGIVHMKDVLKILAEDELAEQKTLRSLHGLVRQVSFIPETRNISTIFQSMQEKKVHLVIVVDEYGQTAGLVAMEDILEEIVGEIQDEYDEEGENILPQTDDTLLIAGLTPLEEVGEELGLDFQQEEFETLNGYLTACLGHIPTEEDKEVIARGYRFAILSIQNNTIHQVRAERINEYREGE